MKSWSWGVKGGTMSNLETNPEQWLEDMFEFENCEECGKDAMYHTAVPFFGNWFASCNEPPLT